MCKSKTSVTKVTQSLISPYSLDTVLSQYQSFPSTNQISNLWSTPRCHSSPATDPLIDATHHRLHLHHHQHHTLIHLLEFFFFFFPSSSAPLFLGHLHRHWFILLILVLDFFFPLLLRGFIDFGFWMVYGSCVAGFVGYGGWFGCFVGLGGGWVVGFRWVVER